MLERIIVKNKISADPNKTQNTLASLIKSRFNGIAVKLGPANDLILNFEVMHDELITREDIITYIKFLGYEVQ